MATEDLTNPRATGSTINEMPSAPGYEFIPFDESNVPFPDNVQLEGRRYIIDEFNLVKRRMRQEEEKLRLGVDVDDPNASSSSSAKVGWETIDISKSTVKGWTKLLEEPLNFDWERPGIEDHDARFERNQQDWVIMFAFHEYIHKEGKIGTYDAGKGRLALKILRTMNDNFMEYILADPPASTDSSASSSGDSDQSGSSGSDRSSDASNSPEGSNGSEEEDNRSGSSGSSSGSSSEGLEDAISF